MFVFNEVHEMPDGLLNVLRSFLDPSGVQKDGLDYSKSIFFFLSNGGGELIRDAWAQSNVSRKTLSGSYFEENLKALQQKIKGGFKDSSLIKSELISAYVPFLPLEREHVRECVYHSLSEAGYSSDKHGSKIETYVNDIMSGRKSTIINGKEYFNEGCKKLDDQIYLAFEDSMDDEL
ncbi:TOR1A [Bugula neritina]|uniref:TOR1A n=1 Tax=Bugula neritina TaxID=10212 RepID=A0A7J7JVV9_BUGNE|nr:TOR1A [Bugula neritina]